MIKTGKVAVEVGGLGVVATMTSGQYFGDIALIQASSGDESAAAAVRTASIRAITYCELFVLTKEDVQYVWERNPGLRTAMEAVMTERVEKNKAQKAKSTKIEEPKVEGERDDDRIIPSDE